MKPEDAQVGDVLLNVDRASVCYTVEKVLDRGTVTTQILVRYEADQGTSIRELQNGTDVPLLVRGEGAWSRTEAEKAP